jgi:large subunit ribosomal protein L3
MRTGVITQKLGMTRLFRGGWDARARDGFEARQMPVVATRTAEKDGYSAVQLGSGFVKAQ